MRTGEALALMRKDLYLASGEAFIEKTKNGDPRMVRLPGRVARALRTAGLPDTGAVFLTPKGKPYHITPNRGGQIQGAFNKARNAAGLGPDVTPHTLRHTWATWFYAQTKDFGGLMDLGGWRKADMANRYRKVAPRDLGADLFEQGWNFTTENAPDHLIERAPRISRI